MVGGWKWVPQELGLLLKKGSDAEQQEALQWFIKCAVRLLASVRIESPFRKRLHACTSSQRACVDAACRHARPEKARADAWRLLHRVGVAGAR
jgi:hypothetical protein